METWFFLKIIYLDLTEGAMIILGVYKMNHRIQKPESQLTKLATFFDKLPGSPPQESSHFCGPGYGIQMQSLKEFN